MARLASLVLAGLAVSSCFGSPPQGAQASTPPEVPPVSGVPPPSYLVLQTSSAGGSPGSMSVKIVDLHGMVAASASFTAPSMPQLASCQTVTQPPVRAAGGAAFYADSAGLVHRLDTSGKTTTAATFKLSGNAQFLSYAVSPDGSRLMASVITAPATGTGHWTLDLESAPLGGATTVVKHVDLGSDPSSGAFVMAGWDGIGPTATADSDLCVGLSPASAEYAGAALVHLSTTGTVMDHVGGQGCAPMDELADGTVLCVADRFDCGTFTVRQANGDTIWRRAVKCPFVEPHLSPDGQAVAASGALTLIYRRALDRPASFARQQEPDVTILGWAGSGLVLVTRGDGELGLSVPINPLQLTDLHLNYGADVHLAGALP